MDVTRTEMAGWGSMHEKAQNLVFDSCLSERVPRTFKKVDADIPHTFNYSFPVLCAS